MKCAIFDLSFPLSNPSYDIGGLFLHWMLRQHNMTTFPAGSADVLLVTSTDPREATKIKTLKQRYPNAKILVGGVGAYAPVAYGMWADAVCVGEGYETLKTLIDKGWCAVCERDNVYMRDKTSVFPDYRFPWHLPAMQGEDKLYRIMCGRGCKNKCKFCSTAWTQPYSEQPDYSVIQRQINMVRQRGKQFAFVSNDPAQHSFADRLPPVSSGSYSIRFLKTLREPPKAKSIRLGIEGVSERVRSKLGKPISSDDLVGCTAWLNAAGISVRWFMMTGFDFERAEDWGEIKRDLQRWKCLCGKGTLGVSFTAFNPHPAIPLGNMSLNNKYESFVQDFKDWFFKGAGWSNKIKLMLPMSHEHRLRIAESALCLTARQIEAGGDFGPNRQIVQYRHTSIS